MTMKTLIQQRKIWLKNERYLTSLRKYSIQQDYQVIALKW